jgi:hypothetical protein
MRYNQRVIHGVFDRGNAITKTRGTLYKQQQPQTKPKTIPRITDKQGLDKAYAANEYLHVNGDTLYVAGTQTARDVWDDITKLPFGKMKDAQRYQDADALLAKNPQVTNLVGHSMGGAAVLELQKNHTEKQFKTNTYNAPLVSITRPDNENNHRYRNLGDPISILDRGAEKSWKSMPLVHYSLAYEEGDLGEFWKGITSAHSYDNFTKKYNRRGLTIKLNGGYNIKKRKIYIYIYRFFTFIIF